MSLSYHTNGTATLRVAGSALGISSADGCKVTINEYTEPVYSDERGPSIPAEIIRNGADAKITFELFSYDPAVLNSFMALREGGTLGQMGQIGELMFANSRMTSFSIDSPVDGVRYNFGRVMVADDVDIDLSTQLKTITMTVNAYPDQSGYLYTLS